MHILYISALSSERFIHELYKRTKTDPGYAVQKFSRLLVKGLLVNHIDVKAITNPPITRQNSSRLFVFQKTERENGITYKYAPIINVPILKQISSFIYIFSYVFFWGLRHKKKKIIICDVLNVSGSVAALLASKFNGITSVGVVTDIYEFMVSGASDNDIIGTIACMTNHFYVKSFDKYVLLTEQMNELVNPKNKPHIIMEALCDSSISLDKQMLAEKESPRCMLYAGGLHIKYGLRMLVDAFIQSGVDGKLVIYGDGPYADELREVSARSDMVDYRGVATNEEVVEAECKASILVNPRFTTEAFSLYSFPSKNMEYMVSGTPLLTTKLSGMPAEYHNYVYLFGEETLEGYTDTIRKVFAKPQEELDHLGACARKFVLDTKNNVVQAKRIVELCTLS